MPTRIPHHVRVYNLAYSGSNYRWESVENILGLEKYLWEFGKALVIQASASFEQRFYRISCLGSACDFKKSNNLLSKFLIRNKWLYICNSNYLCLSHQCLTRKAERHYTPDV